jgi:hypothetical protein
MIQTFDSLKTWQFEPILTIEKAVFNINPTEEQIKVALTDPSMFAVIGNEQKQQVFGYNLIWPLGSIYDEMVKGNVWEDAVTAKDIQPNTPRGYWVASIAANPAFKKPMLNQMLVGNLTGRIHGKHNIAATPVTRTGENMLNRIQFTKNGNQVLQNGRALDIYTR